MKQVTREQAIQSAANLISAAESGEHIVITDNDKTIAQILQCDKETLDINYLHNLTEKLIRVILPLGLKLSAEKDLNKLLELILLEAQDICGADGGTLYLRGRNHELKFVNIRTKSLKLAAGGSTGNPITLPPLKILEDGTGKPNLKFAATWVCINGKTLNIPDVYNSGEFDFSGAKRFDQGNNYKTVSCLSVPLQDNDKNALGVIQLINATEPVTGKIIPFNKFLVQIVESLALQASAALQNHIEKLRG